MFFVSLCNSKHCCFVKKKYIYINCYCLGSSFVTQNSHDYFKRISIHEWYHCAVLNEEPSTCTNWKNNACRKKWLYFKRVTACNRLLEKEGAKGLRRMHGVVIRPRNVEPGGSWILIPGDTVTHWVTLGKSLDLLLYLSHPHWKLGERHELTKKHVLNLHWAFLRKQITMPVAFFNVLCHFACVLWSNSVQEQYFGMLFRSSARDLRMSINKGVSSKRMNHQGLHFSKSCPLFAIHWCCFLLSVLLCLRYQWKINVIIVIFRHDRLREPLQIVWQHI